MFLFSYFNTQVANAASACYFEMVQKYFLLYEWAWHFAFQCKTDWLVRFSSIVLHFISIKYRSLTKACFCFRILILKLQTLPVPVILKWFKNIFFFMSGHGILHFSVKLIGLYVFHSLFFIFISIKCHENQFNSHEKDFH